MRRRSATRRAQQRCNFRPSERPHLCQSFLLRQAMLTSLLFLNQKIIRGMLQETAITVRKLDKALQYKTLILSGEVDPSFKCMDHTWLQGNCCPPGGPFDLRNEVKQETTTLGPAHDRCFAISNGNNKINP